MKIKLTKSQWNRLSEIFGNLGIVAIASVSIPYLFDKQNPVSAFFGLVIAVALWYISIVSARKY